MPKSKSKRKKTGGFIARQRDAKVVRTGKAADKDAYVRAWQRLEAEKARLMKGAAMMELRLAFVDDEELGTAFIRAELAVKKLREEPENFSVEDFKTIGSSIMLGIKVYRHFSEAGFSIAPEILGNLRHGAWILACTGRFFERGESIPAANVDVIHESLDVALALLKDARLLDQEALARILMGNFRVIPDNDLRYVLADRYDQVMAWERKEEKKDGE